MQTYINTANEIIATRDEALDSLGEKIRREVIIPLCRKYKLTFISGNGDFFFTSTKDAASYNGPIYSDPMSTPWPKGNQGKEMRVIFSLLNHEVARNDYIGYYVGDVR